MRRYLNYLLNPFIIPVIPAVILFLFIPHNYDRYVLNMIRSTSLPEGRYVKYDDLTMDGNSELITITDFGHRVSVTLHDCQGVLFDQWNLRGHIDFFIKRDLFISGDYNGDNKKELYIFTVSNDSILLHIIHDPNDPEPLIKDRFIARTGPGIGKQDPFIIKAEMDDINNNGYKELIFGISTGFSLSPRNAFAYFIDQDSLITSPESFYHITTFLQMDITGDGENEIMLGGSSTSNVSPDSVKFHDHSNWLMILDNNLEFLFEPMEIQGRGHSFRPAIIHKDGEPKLSGIYITAHGTIPSSILFFGDNGIITDTVEFDFRVTNFTVTRNKNSEPLLLFSTHNDGLHIYDKELNPVDIHPGIDFSFHSEYDIDGDGQKEMILPDIRSGKLHVYRSGMKTPASININGSARSKVQFSFQHSPESKSKISLQVDQVHYLVEYNQNPYFFLNYALFPALYLGLLLFTLIIRKVYKLQLQKREKIDKRIAELQLNLIKNQLNPHFSLNAINAIIHSLSDNESQKAADYLRCFSRIFRSMLLSAESIHRTIEDELNFCRDYLELERMRFDKSFEYNIKVEPGINLRQPIPKMLIQSYVENAMKHGIFHKNDSGLLSVFLNKEDKNLVITISDNGIGRLEAAEKNIYKDSTGKGLRIMQEFTDLYNKYYKSKIVSQLVDMTNEDGKAEGTKVIINISYPENDN
jgi:two-component sensor histidine kinase